MTSVRYKAAGIMISDRELLTLLDAISDELGVTIEITSGDRVAVPSGGAKDSDHLLGRAADIHIAGYPDGDAFMLLRTHRKKVFGSSRMEFQIIHHGPFTKTQGQHIHIGHVVDRNKAGFWTEGSTQAGRGYYTRVEMP